MSGQHTPGRLVARVDAGGDMSLLVTASDDRGVVAAYVDEPDARRLAACWNACEGCTTASLEKIGDTFIKPMADLESERDQALRELAAARALLREVVAMGSREQVCIASSELAVVTREFSELDGRISSYLGAVDTLEGDAT